MEYLSDENVIIRRAAAIAARNFPSNEIKTMLIKLKNDDDYEGRLFASETLENIN